MQSVAHPEHVDSAAQSKVELKIQCENLINRNVASLRGRQVLLFLYDNAARAWIKHPHAMTEHIRDSLNPIFVKGLEMDFHFNIAQRLKFVVFDIDYRDHLDLSEQEYLGEATTDLGSIIDPNGGEKVMNLTHPSPGRFAEGTLGQIIIHSGELVDSRNMLNFKIQGLGLIKKGLIKKGIFQSQLTMFFVIQRTNEKGTFSPVYKSQMIDSKVNFDWEAFYVKESVICNGDLSRRLRIDVMRHKRPKSKLLRLSPADKLIGSTAEFTVGELSQYSYPHSMSISPTTGKAALNIQSLSITVEPTFLDFFTGGGEINLTVAIDFTASNGDPWQSKSLHFMNPTGENEYKKVIRSVGDILQHYDTDKKFPVYGFGGHVHGSTQHAFPLNGDTNFVS
ncbi:hypothetical protein BGZ99_001889 [Dissophora globulifera]|uniref:C2 domain-containing protein n=1 Tax=Dissophora globulifera TaxID=979702 RepID=A0A9P6R1M3_9FUNG|nr:hypothetical protein BGZ99_001889 [Dissophora globulifera]